MKRPPPSFRLSNAGRKANNTDAEKLEKMGRIGCTMDICAYVFGVSKNTLLSRFEREPELLERYQKGWAETGMSLQNTAYNLAPKLAKQGNVALLIFLLKTRYGFKETAIVEASKSTQSREDILSAIRGLPAEDLRSLREIFARSSNAIGPADGPSGKELSRVYT